jgi:transketolase
MSELTDEKIAAIEHKAYLIRKHIIEMLVEAQEGHPGGALGLAEIFASLYFHILQHDPQNPKWKDRDKLVLSNGHTCPGLYAALALAGYFDTSELRTLRKINSRLQGHPHREELPGIETSSGPLGEGLSQAIGMALVNRMDAKKNYVYCINSDGEHQEGNTWEAIMFAGKNKVANLITIIDRNNTQISDFTENVMPLEPLAAKYEAFGWHVQEIEGSNVRAFVESVGIAKSIIYQPSVIIAHNVSGKGVDFLENDYRSHDRVLSKSEGQNALQQIEIKLKSYAQP